MSKAKQELIESYDRLEKSFNRVMLKFDEVDQSFDNTERLMIGLYVLIPTVAILSWFFRCLIKE
jgi:hypothetical protein